MYKIEAKISRVRALPCTGVIIQSQRWAKFPPQPASVAQLSIMMFRTVKNNHIKKMNNFIVGFGGLSGYYEAKVRRLKTVKNFVRVCPRVTAPPHSASKYQKIIYHSESCGLICSGGNLELFLARNGFLGTDYSQQLEWLCRVIAGQWGLKLITKKCFNLYLTSLCSHLSIIMHQANNRPSETLVFLVCRLPSALSFLVYIFSANPTQWIKAGWDNERDHSH